MLVRLTRITGLDLRLFDFDHDLNFYVFFLGPDERVYGRYGGRDGKSAEGWLSLAGLRHSMRAALNAHAKKGTDPVPRAGKPVLAEEFSAAKRVRKGECIHCHQINEFRREDLKAEGKWSREQVWRYPLPENVGLTVSVDQGDLVRAVARDSPADKAGLRAGDSLLKIDGLPVASFGDIQFALDRAPARGDLRVTYWRDKEARETTLAVAEGWKKTNITWRASLLDVLITPPVYGEDLTAMEKRALGLSEKQLAFRQDTPLPARLREAGMKEGDVIVGVDGLPMETTMKDFLAYLRRNYLVGDKVTLDVLRDGKRAGVPLTLK